MYVMGVANTPKSIKDKLLASLLCLLFCLGISACGNDNSSGPVSQDSEEPTDNRANILLIVADDMGYSDIGAFGGEISTPSLDGLAASGVMMTNFHANPTCSPTRAALMSGVDTHVAGLGIMAEMKPDANAEQLAAEGYSGYLLPGVDALPEKLQEAGYHTYMVGKWHLANIRDDLPGTIPAARGFEKSFALMQGGASHYSDMLAPMPSPIPVGVPGHSQYATYFEDETQVEALPDGFYSTTYYTDKLIEYIDSNEGDGTPYFAYAAYTAPHWPLQLPLEALEEGNEWQQKFADYEAQYAAGYDVLREQRLAQMKLSDLIDRDVEPNDDSDAEDGVGIPEWTSLTSDEQKANAREMAVYAVMVEYLDYQIGRLIDHVDLDNTIVIFMSDNGAEATSPRTVLWPRFPEASVAEYEDLLRASAGTDDYAGYDNLGRPGSYVCYDTGWTRVSATPLRLYKMFTTEGGIRVPFIARYPGMANAGTVSDGFATVMDLMPTFLEVAEADEPVQTLVGSSMGHFLEGTDAAVHDTDYGVGWELLGGRAYIENDYKLFMKLPQFGGDGTWEVYDLFYDPAENHNLVEDPGYLGLYQYLLDKYNAYALENGVVEYGPEDDPWH